MPKSDREVFEYLTSDDFTPFEVDLLTFATFANEKDEWFKPFHARHHREPGQTDIDAWIADITDWRFQQMRNEAASLFDAAARNYLRDELEAEKKAVLETELVRRVTAAGGFGKQLLIALITAILAPVIIGGIIAAALTYNRVFPTLVTIPGPVQQEQIGDQ